MSAPFSRGWSADTMLAFHAVWPEEPKALSHVTHRYTDAPPWKPPKKSKGRQKFDSFEQEAKYNGHDVYNTALVLKAIRADADFEEINPDLIALDLDMAKIAIRMGRVGMPVDEERLAQLETAYRKGASFDGKSRTWEDLSHDPGPKGFKVAGLESAEASFQSYFDWRAEDGSSVPINLQSSKQVQRALFTSKQSGGLGLPAKKVGKTGPSTAYDVLSEIIGLHPAVQDLLDVRDAQKVLGTYVEGLKPLLRRGRLHPSWKAVDQVGGRFSCSPNQTAQPRAFRWVYRAPSGRKLVSADYAALEFRITGALSGGDLFEFLNKPDDDSRKYDPTYDPHSHVAFMVFGEGYTQANEYDQKRLRDLIKRVVYARNYRAQPPKIFEVLRPEIPGLRLDRVVKIVAAYDRRFPEVAQFAMRSWAKAKDDRELRSAILGRRRKWIMGEISPNDAANFPIQSTGADIVNLRMKALFLALPEGAEIIAQVHDSIMVECADAQAEEVRSLMDDLLPCKFDFGFGSMLFDAKAKIGEDWGQV